MIATTGNLKVMPDFSFTDAPPVAILVVPGGFGTRALPEDREVLGWLESKAKEAAFVTSVCTGALLLARAGLLRGRRATTHFGALGLLAEMDASISIERKERVVRDDNFITSAGVAAGIDMALTVVEIVHGREVANDTARYLEFPRTRYSLALTDADQVHCNT
jgi:transcriptional regulator GlxA family with amidase domain